MAHQLRGARCRHHRSRLRHCLDGDSTSIRAIASEVSGSPQASLAQAASARTSKPPPALSNRPPKTASTSSSPAPTCTSRPSSRSPASRTSKQVGRSRSTRPHLRRRRRVLNRRRHPLRPRIPHQDGRSRGPGRRRNDQHPRHRRLHHASRVHPTLPHHPRERVLKSTNGGSENIIYSTHCHDDLGTAVANSLAGIEGGGARQIECTINGIGERAGNAALEEIAAVLLATPPRPLPLHQQHRHGPALPDLKNVGRDYQLSVLAK